MRSEAFLAVRNRSSVTRVPLERILYVQRERRKLLVVCGEERFEYYETIDNVAPLFGKEFYRVNDGCFVNLDLIDKVKGETVLFRGGEKLMLSRDAAIKCKQVFYVYLKTGEQFANNNNSLDNSAPDKYNLD